LIDSIGEIVAVEFDFLTQLPKSDLDDRTFKDLVDECLLRIPRYCPEWTNHNPSDPGVTLIELFAWLTDQMLLRFNQVPRRNYVAFLELLGLALQPPAPAHTVLSFYLTRPQDAQRSIPAILAGAEVATERTETEPAIVFSTDQDLPLGLPRIRHFLTEEAAGAVPQQVRDRFANQWTRDTAGRWTGRQQPVFQRQPQTGDCFYLVFDGAEPLDGNIIQLTIEGEPAGSTGINPNRPPRQWEAWDGDQWQPVLLREEDDGTKGFSFDDVERRGLAGLSEADILLHLPLSWVATTFAGYTGRWLRCRCIDRHPGHDPANHLVNTPVNTPANTLVNILELNTERFSRSPQLTTLMAQTLGGRTPARQCTRIRNELVGESNGTPGQTFYLQSQGILDREAGEYLQVTPLGEPPQVWQEVPNFAESGPGDRHYTLDSRTGRIQFGPLVREPQHLYEEVQLRRQSQWQGQAATTTQIQQVETLEQQYGLVPPRGALLHMVTYRTGGGDRGNVPRQTLRILKTALPYVRQVTNHQPGRDGANEESLDEAVLRVPRRLRTRDRAVTPEDYETLTLQASRAVGKAYCPPLQTGNPPGVVTVYVVPRVPLVNPDRGLAPEAFGISALLQREVEAFIGDRSLLGTQAQFREPDYVGVSVQAVLGVAPDYQLGPAREGLRRRLMQMLYAWLNPLAEGASLPGGQSLPGHLASSGPAGWSLGQRLYQSDVVGLLQTTPGVQFLDTLQLFELRRETGWQRQIVTTGVIDPGPTGLICSWADDGPTGFTATPSTAPQPTAPQPTPVPQIASAPIDRQSAHRIQFLGGDEL
jgi:predicted phage baseplate assembly protein